MPPSSQPPCRENRQPGLSAVFVRVYWILLGNVFVGLAAVRICLGPGALTPTDLAYWGAVASLVAVLYVDVRRLGGVTSDGIPATLRDWRRYASRLVAICAALWVVVHGVARVLRA